ncbi:hypothetical protein ABLE91_28415 [Aquabacter sp. CN5-332]|uniref:hypothetical protein n=1 Tax=Aquabacter sp. CN5-332 TaxID=3156608 RepID=UPI0032B5792F
MQAPVMEGHGYYNAHSELQARSAAEADAVLERALAAVAISPGLLTIADFGCSQGRNSMRPLALMLDRLAERAGPGRDMMVVHTDLPQCDFTSLFVTLETTPNSYRRGRDHVFASVVGRTFYEQLLPADSLTFGWSAFALHWMSTLPLALAVHIWPIFATTDEARALAKVAAADWKNFLAHRARELVPGGQLVLVVGAVDADGASGLEPMMDLANGVLKALVDEGKIAADTYAAMTIPARPRTREEFRAPFQNGELPDLALEELVIGETPNAAMLRWQQTGADAAFAADIAGFFIAAFGPSLFGGDKPMRDLFVSRFTAAIEVAPAEIARPLVTATMRIARR